MQPLADVTVLDFSTLLPGPLCSLLLADAGARVIKVERPGGGDVMRHYVPAFGEASANFALLNRGKESIAVDLKDPDARRELQRLLVDCDVLIEQFRPGVMERLGLSYDQIAEINPGIVYCSITGYGQTGSYAATAGHDLNYVAESGMLDLVRGSDGSPVLPHALVADIGGGTYPAMINILLALRTRDHTGQGQHLDIAMADNVFTFLYWCLASGHAIDEWPRPASELLTGASPRYNLYETADGRHVAVAALEDQFWNALCDLLALPEDARDDDADPSGVRDRVANAIRQADADTWRQRLAGAEACASVVLTMQEAATSDRVAERGLLARSVVTRSGAEMPALPVPLAPRMRGPDSAGFPEQPLDGSIGE